MAVLIDFTAFPDPATRLGYNKKIVVSINTLLMNIPAADGTMLTKDTCLTFYTEATPMYTTVDHVILEGGEVLDALPEVLISLEIYASSSQLNGMLLFDPDTKFTDKTTQSYMLFRRARQEFTKCLTIRNLLRSILSSRGLGAGRRTLADFTIDSSSQANLIAQARSFANEMAEQCRFWLKAIYSCGQRDFEFNSPQSGVKSGLNEWEPGGIGRGWLIGGPTLNSREYGVINTVAGTKNRPRRGYNSGSF